MPTPIITQRNNQALHRIRAMEKQRKDRKLSLALASHTEIPQQPDVKTRANAVVARAIMTDSAHASFFTDDIPANNPPMESDNA